jgi:hypothetical protein
MSKSESITAFGPIVLPNHLGRVECAAITRFGVERRDIGRANMRVISALESTRNDRDERTIRGVRVIIHGRSG